METPAQKPRVDTDRLPIDAQLDLVAFRPDASPHISIDQLACVACPIDRICTYICPAQNYRWDPLARIISVSTQSCFECGTCRIACTAGGITWKWPAGGTGVQYVEG